MTAIRSAPTGTVQAHRTPGTSRFRLLASITVACVLSLGAAIVDPRAVAAAGACGASSIASDKVYVDKDSSELSSSTFDLVRGDATVGPMDPCVGTEPSAYAAGSWILVANIESATATPRKIVQVGYGKGCSLCADDFIYTPDAAGTGAAWPGTLTPVSGHRVRGIIERRVVGPSGVIITQWTVIDVTTGATQTASINGFYGAYDKAWWGAEALDTSSEVGQDYLLDSNVAYMGYSTFATGTISYRSGMVFNTCYCESEPPGHGPSDVEKQGGTNSTEHGHLGTWVYGNDMVNFESH